MNEHMQLSLFPARVAASVLGLFGLVALILAVIGIYGVTSYSVSQRTGKIGISMALGADKREVLRLILTSGVQIGADRCRYRVGRRYRTNSSCYQPALRNYSGIYLNFCVDFGGADTCRIAGLLCTGTSCSQN